MLQIIINKKGNVIIMYTCHYDSPFGTQRGASLDNDMHLVCCPKFIEEISTVICVAN